MDQWPQGIRLDQMKEVEESKTNLERKPRVSNIQDQLNCPRCNSTNTKFCYYNNYSLTQPRYFCKSCRRYWTEGGTLRNVPVRGGSRKNKKSSSQPLLSPSSSFSSKLPGPNDLNQPTFSNFLSQNPNTNQVLDCNLAFGHPNSAPSTSHYNASFSALELFKTGNSGFVPDSSYSLVYSSGFPIQEFKQPNLASRNNEVHQDINGASRVFFPFGLSSTTEDDHSKGGGSSGGYWINGGSW